MPRRKKINTDNKITEPVIKKKRGRKKKKTLDENQEDVIIIDLQRDNNDDRNNAKYNHTDLKNKKYENKQNDEVTKKRDIIEKNKINDISNDLILHLKNNNNNLSKDISGASISNINNNSILAPFNNTQNLNSTLNNNSSYNINNFLSYKLLDNDSNKETDTKKTEVKNIFSFINKNNDKNNDENNHENNNTDNFNIDYNINTFNRNNDVNLNISSSSFNNDINQDTMKDNINKIKYAFDNNRKWLSKTDVHCLWCCHNFNSVPIAIPKKIVDETFHLFGYFCSFNCAASYIFGTNILASNKWEYYSLLCLLRKKITGSDKYEKIKLAPPKECLKIFGGFLSIDEYRQQLQHVDEYTLRMPPMVSIESTIENSIVK